MVLIVVKLTDDVEVEPEIVLVLELLVADVVPSDVLMLAVVGLPEVEVATNVVEVDVAEVLLLILELLVV